MTSPARTDRDPRAAWSPEVELLLCSARSVLDDARRDRFRALLRMPLRWDGVVRMAWLHRVLPLLYWHLNRLGDDGVPAETRASLRAVFMRNAGRNLKLMHDLQGMLDVLGHNGIPAMPYKGPVLGQQLYGNVALREIGDLDIIVRAEHIGAAQGLLREMGFRPEEELTAAQERMLLRSDCNRVLVHGDSGEILELHWAVAGPRFATPVGMDDLWARASRQRVGSGEFLLPSSEDLLLVLCYHGSRHMWERLEWIAGVAELVRIGCIDWDATLRVAEANGSRRMLLLGLRLTDELLDAPVPAELLRMASRDRGLEMPLSWVRTHLFPGEAAWSHSLGLRFHRFQLAVKERPRDRLRYALHAIGSPAKEDWRAVPTMRVISPLYSLLRPARLLTSYGSRYLRRGP